MTAAATGALILVRHGESTWNSANLFTGWADVPLTERGVREAEYAGRLIRDSDIGVDVVYTSVSVPCQAGRLCRSFNLVEWSRGARRAGA